MKYQYYIGKKLLCTANEPLTFSKEFPSVKEVKIRESARAKKAESENTDSGDNNSTLNKNDKEE